jgi:hypothetical protein
VKFDTLVGYSDEKFHRITGVKRVTFEKNARNTAVYFCS